MKPLLFIGPMRWIYISYWFNLNEIARVNFSKLSIWRMTDYAFSK